MRFTVGLQCIIETINIIDQVVMSETYAELSALWSTPIVPWTAGLIKSANTTVTNGTLIHEYET